ncbi:MAG: Glutamate--cysteine ligase [Candidatus Accumulibacter regalis]|jgi:glutamate--cysteine ligase|uniref:Glutamate--cysteine ligase n=1 Tax=Accumulibacter regalis TaxID=522306 RepID=A0A011QJA8_ACCRE|nr:glutamate--cysteine ligase [Accumulibacter sp.]EXI89442.1 MAG: Glutamate--cysteine ligase [Candidatus Accumulibacter regalis]MQM35800.1 glutamate--cysteine ligase [Candidatus Accumulibacter phosphatis]MBL8366923.1 glutamate--cysteine ligase [Accumulibacter sp.]MBN8514274.1 glutamate--cysteine ligase [Accumulibacter sp.]HRE70928.1 glutamate--cysteine ligase [Accumulibacter sp.]
MLTFTCCDEIRHFFSAGCAQALRGITRGYERECLRVDASGHLAQTPHPLTLGSKLTHPWITTDYGEALLEFITPPSQDPAFPLDFLRDIHRFAARQLQEETMWAGSMPCVVGDDKTIAIANYGTSNSARMKAAYREGLGLRYGRHMQAIAGAHYNWSLPDEFWAILEGCCSVSGSRQDFVSERYFGLIRNFLRFGWLIPYLFGASPAICQSFLQGRSSDLQELVPGTLFRPYATSLRMSDLGYQNRAQDQLHVSFNSLAEYTQALEIAIRTPDPFYQELGVRDGDHWRQLNANLLQIENEFYAGIRPKRVGKAGERPALALKKYGVEYLEVRLFDLNPFVDVGIAPEQATFADILLLMCLFRQSPPITAREQGENDENLARIVNRGRQPGLNLLVHNRKQAFRPIAHALFDDMQPFAQMLDAAYAGNHYSTTLASLRTRIDHPESTPSAQVLAAAREHKGYFKYAMQQSQKHHEGLLAQPLDAATLAKFEASVQASLAEQQRLEALPQGRFEDYVASYYA